MLELDDGPRRPVGNETDLHLAGLGRIQLKLPVQVDVPLEREARGRLVADDGAPPAGAAIGADVVQGAADLRLDDGIDQLAGEDVVLRRPPRLHVLGEDVERPLDGRLNDDRRADGCLGGSGHGAFLSCCSTSGRQVVAFAAITDGTTAAIEGARARLELAIPERAALTEADHDAKNQSTARNTQRISDAALAVTLVIAGCSLAIATASSILERRRSFALLRLAGACASELRRAVLAEAAPLLVVSLATVGLGMGVTALTLASDPHSPPFAPPALAYWAALLGGLTVALAVVAATLPLLRRLTEPGTVHFE